MELTWKKVLFEFDNRLCKVKDTCSIAIRQLKEGNGKQLNLRL